MLSVTQQQNNNASGNISWGNRVGNGVAVPDTFSSFSNNGMAGRDSVNFYKPRQSLRQFC